MIEAGVFAAERGTVMLERNRTFGRVSRPVDKTSAPRQAVAKQRKSGRIRNAAAVRSKPQPRRPRETPQAIGADPAIRGAAPVDTLPAAIAAEAPFRDALAASGEAEAREPLPGFDPPDTFPERKPTDASAPQRGASTDVAPFPSGATPRRAAKRRPILRLAVAASVALACLLTLARFCDAHLSAPAVLALATPAGLIDETTSVEAPMPQTTAFTLPPTEAAMLPALSATAADGTGDLAETAALPPQPHENVTAQAAASSEKAIPQAARVPASRNPAAKRVAARGAVPRGKVGSSQERGYRSPIVDFLSDLIP